MFYFSRDPSFAQNQHRNPRTAFKTRSTARSAHAVGPVRRAIHVAAEGIDLRRQCSSQSSIVNVQLDKKGSTCQNGMGWQGIFRTYVWIHTHIHCIAIHHIASHHITLHFITTTFTNTITVTITIAIATIVTITTAIIITLHYIR